MNTKYKNLLFDADQTLIDFEKDMPLAFQYMYEQSGLAKQKPYSAEILRLYNDCNESWWRRFEQKLCTKAELYRNRFVDFFEVAGLTPVSIDFLQDLYVSGIARTGTPLPGALDMLRALSERYDLYVTTNGNPISQPGRLKNSGVTAFMKGCFISDEEVEDLVDFIKHDSEAEYDEEILDEINRQLAENNGRLVVVERDHKIEAA